MKLQIGGSPCTHWSIAQTRHRETEPSGIGWDLFENYLIALEKFQPDFFLYENNKSMSSAIRAEITKRFGFEPVCINSALVSAQNRQRLYWCGKRGPDGAYRRVDVPQPEDRGILLRDILETGVSWRDKAYTLRASHGPHGGESSVLKSIKEPGKFSFNGAAEPIRVGDMPNKVGEIRGGQAHRIYAANGKSVALTARPNGGGVDGPLYAAPAGVAWRGRGTRSAYEVRADQKSNSVTAEGHQSRLVIEGAAVFQRPRGFNKGGLKYDKAPTLTANGDWAHNNLLIEPPAGKTSPVYEVRNGLITVKDKQYPIKLADGYYVIRKLTVRECMRLQTIPERYAFPVSNTQAYKMLGNGWTVDVIAHILSYCDGLTAEPLDVLSMYDGMACGHLALDKLGARITRYHATEIDKYAIKTACHNFPDIIQLGDAYQVRRWT